MGFATTRAAVTGAVWATARAATASPSASPLSSSSSSSSLFFARSAVPTASFSTRTRHDVSTGAGVGAATRTVSTSSSSSSSSSAAAAAAAAESASKAGGGSGGGGGRQGASKSTTPATSPGTGVAELDFELLSKDLTSDTASELSRLRQTLDEMNKLLGGSKSGTVDWDHWRRTLRVPSRVDEFKRVHDAWEPPSVDEKRDELLSEVDSAFKPLIDQARKLAKECESRARELEARAKEVGDTRSNLDEMTVDEYLARDKEAAKEVEETLENRKWFGYATSK